MAKKKYEEANIQAIAETIREKTGRETTYYTSEMASGVNEVYEKGNKKGYDAGILAMWDAMTTKGKREAATRLFNECDFTDIETLPYPIKPKNLISQIFYNYNGKILPRPQYVDLSMPNFPTDNNANHTASLCQYWTANTHNGWMTNGVFPDYGIPASNFCSSWFANSNAIKTIVVLRCHKDTQFYNTFNNTVSLVNITFEGVIGKDLNMSSCTKLSHDSLLNIIDCLYDYSEDTSGTVHTLTIGTTNQAKLSDDEKKEIEDKGWVLK